MLLNVFNFLADATTGGGGLSFCETGSTTLFIFQVARLVIRIIQVAVPFALIIWGSLDFFKAVIAGDEKEMKQKRKPFVQRLIAAIIVLLLPTIINVIMKNLAKNENNTFAGCWDAADPSNDIDIPESDDSGNWQQSETKK